MTTSEYNTYAATAIGGTLLFLIPGALWIFDVSGLLTDFLFSALIGGGVAIYAALRKDTVAEYANKLGDALLNGAGKVIEKVDIPRVALPSSVTDVLAANDLKDPNDMTSSEYNTYSATAIGGTLLFFLPGALLIFDVSGALLDFLFSAFIGGGTAIYASLRKDEVSEYANKFGNALLKAVETVGEKLK
mmetsp:Transcript_96636/g.141334  ORF Transcript_96636/g.141334 Transcript_96636/m.141334 type:complete len:189 (-) Transcript_96636:233-799(-)